MNIHGIVNFEYINFLIWKHILKPHKMNMFFDFLMDNEKWKWNRKLKIEKGKHFFITQHTLITSRTSIICNIIWTKNKAHLQGVPLLLGLGPEWLGISFGTKAHLVGKITSLLPGIFTTTLWDFMLDACKPLTENFLSGRQTFLITDSNLLNRKGRGKGRRVQCNGNLSWREYDLFLGHWRKKKRKELYVQT